MKIFFEELFEYNYKCNQKLSHILTGETGPELEKSITLLSHILNAHHIWNHRIQGITPATGVWDVHPAESFAVMDTDNLKNSLDLLRQYDFNLIIHYVARGSEYQNTFRDILFHVINHSTYHRAQIATEFRRIGLEPIPTDYIIYKRKGSLFL